MVGVNSIVLAVSVCLFVRYILQSAEHFVAVIFRQLQTLFPTTPPARYSALVEEFRARFAQTVHHILALRLVIDCLDRNLALIELPIELRTHFTILRNEYQDQLAIQQAILQTRLELSGFTDPSLYSR